MKKKLGVICMTLLGLGWISDTGAMDEVVEVDVNENAEVSNGGNENFGIMKGKYVKKVKNQKKQQDIEEKNQASKQVKNIEINSVNFLKFKKKIKDVFIPNNEVADIDLIDNQSLYLTGLAPGITPLVLQDEDGKVIGDYQIRVTYPIKEIKSAIEKIFPDIDIELVSIEDNLIMKGKIPSPEMASDLREIVSRFVEDGKIINKLTIETATQVMLKVKVAEITRDATKELGVNWRAISATTPSAGMIGIAHGSGVQFPEFAADVDTLKTNLFADSGQLNKITGGRWIVSAGVNNLSALIDALATENLGSVLAEPTLVALSGKSATFKSGGQQGFTVNQDGTNSRTTEFKDWGTSIEFTPVVLSEDRINIKVKAEVSTVQANANTDGSPNILEKTVETVIELGSGQSMALAGLLQTTKSAKATETPILADIPLIGSLFRNTKMSVDEKELVITVTPYIVKPSSKKLKLPTDMLPKMLSPIQAIPQRKFTVGNKGVSSAGFSLR